MADDVKKSEVITEPVEGAGGELKVTDDMPDSVKFGSVQKKKKVRKRPASGEQGAGRTKAEPQAGSESKGKKTRKVRKKRAESGEITDVLAEDGAELKKKKVHIKKADPVMDGQESANDAEKQEPKKRVRKRARPESGSPDRTAARRSGKKSDPEKR